MKVAKIGILAPVVSFRYPHFLVGKQVSYVMPPPSTIYGHIASAVGSFRIHLFCVRDITSPIDPKRLISSIST